MPQVTPTSILANIRQEAALFESKDRLLNFSTKSDFTSPLVLEAGDLFYEKWTQTKEEKTLDSFLPVSATFTAQQKATAEDQFVTVLKEKQEDFGTTDLYLVLGYLKWDGNALSPSLLVPLNFNQEKKSLTLSNKLPIENVVLRERLEDVVNLPKAEDAVINGQFSILLYFSLFEKAIASEHNWKFTRHGLCLAFFDTRSLLLKKNFERDIWSDKKTIDTNPFIAPVLSTEGFQVQESIFEESSLDQVFDPTDHYFLYPIDSHTTKVAVDALLGSTGAFALQTLPGTEKMKVASNIVAEALAHGKKTLVVHRRKVSQLCFNNTFKPQFRSFNGPEREQLLPQLRKMREGFKNYSHIVNKTIQPANTSLSELLSEFSRNPATKTKFAESIFQEVGALNYEEYRATKADLELVSALYFNKQGVEARKAFRGVNVPHLSKEEQQTLEKEVEAAAAKTQELQPLLELIDKAGIFPTGIYLAGLADILDLIIKNFNRNTPVFENWELRSSSWAAYEDSLKHLPEAGDNWVRYRRQTSDIYTEDAVDENVAAARIEFADSLKATLKGLSDRYRGSKRQLMRVIKNPKTVDSDAKLLDLIDTLLELQENKRIYKDTSVLGNHLLGKDWLYEKSNWVELDQKIKYIYNFRDNFKDNPRQLDILLLILEKWHLFKDKYEQMKDYAAATKALQASIRHVASVLQLEKPLDTMPIDAWHHIIISWNKNWQNLNIHIQLTSAIAKIEKGPCKSLAEYLKDCDKVSKDIVQAYAHYWSGTQIALITKEVPDLFSETPQGRTQKSKDYQNLFDQFCNANFREVAAALEKDPSLLRCLPLEETFVLNPTEKYDLVVLLDADCTTIVESLPSLILANKLILMGNPQSPAIEVLPFDGYLQPQTNHTAFFQEDILSASLRKGIPTRELWLTTAFSDYRLIRFANDKVYNHSLRMFPKPTRNAFRGEHLKVVPNKVMAIAEAAITHAEKYPGQTLGIVAFHQSTCREIEAAIKALITKDSPVDRFFNQKNPMIAVYVKTAERATDKLRDCVFVCAEADGASGYAGEHKVAVCTSLAKQELFVFISESDISKQAHAKHSLFWDWISYLQKKLTIAEVSVHSADSILRKPLMDTLSQEHITIEEYFAPGGIPVGPVIVDANNSKRFLALIEDDCTIERFRESVEDREYIRPTMLKSLGWKVLNIWLPFWFMFQKDETEQLSATIAIEQSVAPPPLDEDQSENSEEDSSPSYSVVSYKVLHPKIEGTPHDKPIAELPAASIITQIKFYVDHEGPIHEELLMQRVLELHHIDRAGPVLRQALADAIKQGLQKKRFIKTGSFFYPIVPAPVELRSRADRPDLERKLAYVAPEERALLPASMDEFAIKQALGLVE
ncbi:MAG: DUF3320 domain-containing protein [Fibrobacteraceae bacterium]|nr:DUF3320 domain-containing protein [Fibrobacteraceae bacterium]